MGGASGSRSGCKGGGAAPLRTALASVNRLAVMGPASAGVAAERPNLGVQLRSAATKSPRTAVAPIDTMTKAEKEWGIARLRAQLAGIPSPSEPSSAAGPTTASDPISDAQTARARPISAAPARARGNRWTATSSTASNVARSWRSSRKPSIREAHRPRRSSVYASSASRSGTVRSRWAKSRRTRGTSTCPTRTCTRFPGPRTPRRCRCGFSSVTTGPWAALEGQGSHCHRAS
mmetsp:Transcript_22124/g.68988  ORF Transcript_22124/g.68988 Transcript_22124/m.68988 type:complete len:233 (+) Transcript_22124:262-960(+)